MVFSGACLCFALLFATATKGNKGAHLALGKLICIKVLEGTGCIEVS